MEGLKPSKSCIKVTTTMDNNLLNNDNFANKKGTYKTPFKNPVTNGKLQPQALELEEVVLGALMIEKEAINDVIDILYPDTFYKPAHQEIYNAIKELFQNSEPIDIITVTQKLRSLGKLEFVGGAYVIAELTSRVNSAANIVYHSRLLMQYAIKRALITICSKIETQAFEDTTDVLQLLDAAQQSLFDVSEKNIRKNYMKMKDLMSIALEELEAKKDKKDGLTGVPTGFNDLDQVTSGWQRSDLIILAARPGMGKCVRKGTKVLLFNGELKKVEDIEVGEFLMGDDSTPRKVLSLARGQEKMYWINQNKGIRYGVNESHILSLKRSRNEGKHKKGEVLHISVKEYLEKSDKFKSNYKGYKVAVEFAEKPVTIEPYFLGMWLGDGASTSTTITNVDEEVVEYLKEYADRLGLRVTLPTNKAKHPDYRITSKKDEFPLFSLLKGLQNLNLIRNKHIPQHYLVNSTENRLSLLAGLLDSDGHYLVQSNGYEITQKNQDLARQIKFLCDTLGFRTSLTKKKAQITSINYECDVWRVRIYGDIDKIPVKVERKKARAWGSKIDWKVTGFKIEYDKVDDYYGFEIDGNRLFLLEDMTVTHNTAFVVSALRNAAVDHQKAVAIFSLEMSAIQLVNRLLSAEAELNSEKIKKGNLMQYEWEQLHSKITKLTEAPIFIDDTPALSVLELRAKARRLKAQHNIELLIVDYLQLMSGGDGGGGKGNREQEIAFISRSLKNIAKELDIPVIALSQLSRAVETRGGDKKPMLSDLRESGSIEQDADMVIFLYRPEYYKITQDENGMPCENMAEVIIAKHRNGSLDTVKLKFIGEFTKFGNMDNFGFGADTTFSAEPTSFPTADAPNQFITLASKMNDTKAKPTDNTNETAPF